MDLREATIADLGTICEFDQVAREDEERVTFVEKAISSRSCLVATLDEEIVGYGVLEYSFYGRGFISMIYVSADHRRHGIGARLVQELEDKCATSQLFTSTNESNLPMQMLLGRLGYEPSGVIHNLDPGDPELVYVKTLRAPPEFSPRA